MKEEFEIILKQKAEQFSIEPSANLWSKIDAQMGAQVIQKAKFDWASFLKSSLNTFIPIFIAASFGTMFYFNTQEPMPEVSRTTIQKPAITTADKVKTESATIAPNLHYSIFQPVGFIATLINQADTTEQKAKEEISDEKIDELVNQEVEKYQKTVDHYRATLFFENEKKVEPKQN